ncbi:DUF551 domain-containing protein [Cronobacter dublinensis]
MSTISNELVKNLRMEFSVWQQDYDPVEDKEQYEMFGLGVVAMDELLALRKELERAEPVHDQDMCDHEVFERGASACLVNIPKDAAEIICQGISAATGCMIDWHYVGGRVHIKALRTAPTAPTAPPVADDSLPHDPQIAEYEQMMEAEQTQADTTSQQFESLASVKQQSSKDAATSKASRDSDANSSPDSQTTIKQSDGWISCSERMPETNDHFMVTGDSFDHDLAFWNGKEWSDLDYYSEVTHWMPLPAPPAE